MSVINVNILQQNSQMITLPEFFSRKKKVKSKGVDSITLVSGDYTARPNEEIKVCTGDRVVTITFPKIKGQLTEPIMYEVTKDDKGSGKIIIVDEGGLKFRDSKTYEIKKHNKSLRVITNGVDYVLF